MKLAPLLARSKTSDGGFSSTPGGSAEPEPTAMAAIALGDADATEWLLRAQRADGSFGIEAGSVIADSTACVCLALPDGEALERALDHVERVSGSNAIEAPGTPPFGWPWTLGAHGWTEPTSWGVLALRAKRPSSSARIADGLAVLNAQECAGGGWNYGTRESFGVLQPPFVQTTSVALLATRGADEGLTGRGLKALADRWRSEAGGPLSLATAAAALRGLGHPDAPSAAESLERTVATVTDPDTIFLAWASIALGPGLEAFRVL